MVYNSFLRENGRLLSGTDVDDIWYACGGIDAGGEEEEDALDEGA